MKTLFFVLTVTIFVFVSRETLAAYPGQCQTLVYYQTSTPTYNGTVDLVSNATPGQNGTLTLQYTNYTKPTYIFGSLAYVFNDNGTWATKDIKNNLMMAQNIPATRVYGFDHASIQAAYGDCPAPNPCLGKQGAPIYEDSLGYPSLTNLPYHAPYYQTVGVCIDGCKAAPSGPVILNQYADDGSGWTVAPFTFTGAPCDSQTENPPPQPPPEDVCSHIRNACEAQCAGKSYDYDCDTGGCSCTGAPSYNTDPPLAPVEPDVDPGSPQLPSNQTATPDPGGDAQLGAQISNQSKQIEQSNAELGQLGALNSKLGAVINNQGKMIGQLDKGLDYQRQGLGVSKDILASQKEGNGVLGEINDKLDILTNPEVPGFPGYGDMDDGSLGDAKNWTEYDDAASVGASRAQNEINRMPSTQTPLNFGITTNGATPVLSGTVLGSTIEIRFDRPWMQTGYSLMHAIFIGVGYLQAFLMINSTFTRR